MRRIAHLTLLLVLLTTTCTGDKTAPYNTAGYSIGQLQDDFDRYVHLIHRDHPMTFTDRAILAHTIDAQKELLREGMSEMEFYAVVAPVGAAVRCGHTRTYLSERGRDYLGESGRCLPLEVRLVSDSLYVFKDFTPEEAIPRGSRVLSINTHPAAEIIERMRASRHADGINITYKDYAINLLFANLFTILYGGAAQFELEIEEPGSGGPATISVKAMTPNQADRMDEERYHSETNCRRLCMSFAEDSSYAVLTIKDFGYYGDVDAFREPVGEFFARLAGSGIGTLIIDVRGNDGGDPYCSSFVVSHVMPEPVHYFSADTRFYGDLVRPIPVPRHVFTGELYVLTDGWCFSSTTHMLSLLRCHHRGVVVGEESGGSSVCNDASKEHVLKHTRLRLNLPRRTFATSAKCLPMGRGIPPDIAIQPTIGDLISGRDVVLEKAISLVASH
ncbi:S41 family peptidase [Candidatus Eisenbacteria bacterium]|uniref:S41 family peptidase n=1 Tax=Eiseniibacteriota bacterium TaxID=2212470 RepID=A0ABV6YJW2_UNCEI